METARHYPFRYGVILANAPRESGLFALFRGDEPLYVNEADSIYVGLLQHFENHESVSDSDSAQPTSFAFEICAPERRKGRFAQTVCRLHPTYTERPDLKAQES